MGYQQTSMGELFIIKELGTGRERVICRLKYCTDKLVRALLYIKEFLKICHDQYGMCKIEKVVKQQQQQSRDNSEKSSEMVGRP